MKIAKLLKDFIYLLFPPTCVGCGRTLLEGEEHLCLSCLLKLPRTRYLEWNNNPAAERFYGKVDIERAYSLLYYTKKGTTQRIIFDIKYRGNRPLGYSIGRLTGKELLPSGFFDGIDCLVPVPLHPSKQRSRGYNQAEVIARGISEITQIPLTTGELVRIKANISQTGKGVYERWENTKDIFQLNNKALFAGKHILLIDDVLTTGSTLAACAACFQGIPELQISILTVAIT